MIKQATCKLCINKEYKYNHSNYKLREHLKTVHNLNPPKITMMIKHFIIQIYLGKIFKKFATAGNRTRAARVAGEHSTTEPPLQHAFTSLILLY